MSLPVCTYQRCQLTKIVVVRHGETHWNRKLRVQGTTDIPLNERGRKQAEKAAEFIRTEIIRTGRQDTIPKVIHSSMLSRASETGVAVAEALSNLPQANGKEISVMKHAELNEWNLGVIEGMTKDEASKSYPGDWAVFSQWASPTTVSNETATTQIKEGESMEEVRLRVVSKIEEICKSTNQESVMVATHGGILGQLLRHVAQQKHGHGTEMEEYASRRPANGCISIFSVGNDGRWEIIDWAQDDHLVDDAAPVSTNYDVAANEEKTGS